MGPDWSVLMVGVNLQQVHKSNMTLTALAFRTRRVCHGGLEALTVALTESRPISEHFPAAAGEAWRTVASPGQAGVRPRKQKAQSEGRVCVAGSGTCDGDRVAGGRGS